MEIFIDKVSPGTAAAGRKEAVILQIGGIGINLGVIRPSRV